jgi:hypothetical protein
VCLTNGVNPYDSHGSKLKWLQYQKEYQANCFQCKQSETSFVVLLLEAHWFELIDANDLGYWLRDGSFRNAISLMKQRGLRPTRFSSVITLQTTTSVNNSPTSERAAAWWV